MKKWFFLVLGCFSLIYAQIRQYFVIQPTRPMAFVLKSIQSLEEEIQRLCKILKETFKKAPDSLLYTPHSFTPNVSWSDVGKALEEARLHVYRVSALVDEIDEYESYEHPAVAVYRYHEKIWKNEIRKLLDTIKSLQKKGFAERAEGYSYQFPFYSSIYHPSTFHAVRKWQTKRPTQPDVMEEQAISQLN